MLTKTDRATVVGLFSTRFAAQRAVNELRRNGYPAEEIGMASRDEPEVATELSDTSDNVATAVTTGVVAGGAGGALWGLGIAAGLLPGIGPVIAGGTLAAILASAATGAATAGVAGCLIGLGLPEEQAEYYQSQVAEGRTIVTVNTPPGRFREAQDILNRVGGLPS